MLPPIPSSWAELHLPVCHALLLRSRCYLCSLAMRFAELALSEASKITGILVSIKCARTTQVCTTTKLGITIFYDTWGSSGAHDLITCSTDHVLLGSYNIPKYNGQVKILDSLHILCLSVCLHYSPELIFMVILKFSDGSNWSMAESGYQCISFDNRVKL